MKIETGTLTDPQIRHKVTAAVKVWLKDHGYENKVFFRFVRGTYHFDNCGNYMLDAKTILQIATGLEFTAVNESSAKRVTDKIK